MQSPQDNKPKPNLLNQIRSMVTSGKSNKTGTDRIIYQLSAELGCLGDLIGREFEFVFRDEKIVGFRQKPIRVAQLLALIRQAEIESEIREKQAKQKKGRR